MFIWRNLSLSARMAYLCGPVSLCKETGKGLSGKGSSIRLRVPRLEMWAGVVLGPAPLRPGIDAVAVVDLAESAPHFDIMPPVMHTIPTGFLFHTLFPSFSKFLYSTESVAFLPQGSFPLHELSIGESGQTHNECLYSVYFAFFCIDSYLNLIKVIIFHMNS